MILESRIMSSSRDSENLKRGCQLSKYGNSFPLKKRRINYKLEEQEKLEMKLIDLPTIEFSSEPENLSTKPQDLRIQHQVKVEPTSPSSRISGQGQQGQGLSEIQLHYQFYVPHNTASIPTKQQLPNKRTSGPLEPISFNPPVMPHHNPTNTSYAQQIFASLNQNYYHEMEAEVVRPFESQCYIAPLRSFPHHISPTRSFNTFDPVEVNREVNRLSELETATYRLKVEPPAVGSGVFRRESVISHSKHQVTGFHGGQGAVDRDTVSRSSCDSGVSSPGESSSHSTMSTESRSPTNTRYQCTHCAKSYSTVAGLSKHIQFHCTSQVTKTFVCKDCNKVYTSLGALKMHIRTHTLPCKCTLCPKSFSRPWLLQGHLRIHTGEKPFVCQHCHRAFADRSNLRAHLQTHSEVKKYSCSRCAKTFSRMSLLSKHEESGCSRP